MLLYFMTATSRYNLNIKSMLTFAVERLTVYRFLVLVDGLFRISFTFL